MLRLAAILCCAALPAGAACLGPADLDRGVRVTFDNSDWTEIRRQPDGTMEWDEYYASTGGGVSFQGILGLYPTADWTFAPGLPMDRATYSSLDWGADAARLVEPAADAEWWDARPRRTLPPSAGGTGDQMDEGWAFGYAAAAPVAVPGCRYEAVGVTYRTEQRWPDGTFTGRDVILLYLPALGAGFVVAARGDGGPWVSALPTAIEPAGLAP